MAPGRIADTDAETAVRRYLTYLDDPASLVDNERLQELERELSAASDPIHRLRLVTEIRACRNPDGTQLRSAFIRCAKAWADEQGIPIDAFRQLGVPDADLRAAGWTVRRSTADQLRERHPSGVTAAEIQRHIATLDGPFTLADVTAQVGGSPMTLRKAIRALLAQGAIAQLPAEPSQTRGRAPTRYRTVRSSRRNG